MQEMHFHCQAEVSRDSVLHYLEYLNQKVLEGAENQVAAAAVAADAVAVVAAVVAAHFLPVPASVWLQFWLVAYFSDAFAVKMGKKEHEGNNYHGEKDSLKFIT